MAVGGVNESNAADFLKAGAVGLGIGGKVKVGDEKGDIFGDEGGLKRSDLGVRLGAGVVWKRIYFGLGYDIGCLNLVKESDGEGTMRNNCFTISVGYNF